MAEQIDNRLVYEILKSVQARLIVLEAVCTDLRDGFASLHGRTSGQHDAAILERRLGALERDMERVRRRLHLAENRDRS